jgi:IS30 family transposase
MNHTPVSAKEVDNIKLLLSKGLDTAEICTITGRSHQTINRVAAGKFDNKFAKEPEKVETKATQAVSSDELREFIAKALDLLAKIEGAI